MKRLIWQAVFVLLVRFSSMGDRVQFKGIIAGRLERKTIDAKHGVTDNPCSWAHLARKASAWTRITCIFFSEMCSLFKRKRARRNQRFFAHMRPLRGGALRQGSGLIP